MTRSITQDEFLIKLFSLVGDEYSLKSNFKNLSTNIILVHNSCGYEWNVRPSAFIHQKQRCPKCQGVFKKSTEDFKNEIFLLTNGEYLVLGEYRTAHTKILFEHVKCGYKYEITPHNFLCGDRCIFCGRGGKKTHESFVYRFNNLNYQDEYEIISEYIDSHKKMKFKHKVCNNVFESLPFTFLNDIGCPHCFRNTKKTNEYFQEELNNKFGNQFEVIGEYKNNHSKVLIKHKICNREFLAYPSNLLKRGYCIYCNGRTYYDTQSYQEEVIRRTNGEYESIGEYINSATKVLMKHNTCGNFYEAIPNSFLCGSRCPHCACSKGEKCIKKYLVDNNISFKHQYTFADCINIGRLIFDFAIFEDKTKSKLKYLIEYDGKQHYKPIKWFGGQEGYNRLKINDNIKNTYCQNNNIKLIRIPYWEFNNIENILKKLSDL